MNYLLNSLVMRPYLTWRMRRISDYMRNPEKYQEYWFKKILDSAQNTEIGRKYHFGETQ
jgi:hypothetical protein